MRSRSVPVFRSHVAGMATGELSVYDISIDTPQEEYTEDGADGRARHCTQALAIEDSSVLRRSMSIGLI